MAAVRSFEERKAEIFRRSEEKLKKRRRTRNRAFACCISAVFCAAVCTVILLQQAETLPDTYGETAETSYWTNGNAWNAESHSATFVKAEVLLKSGEGEILQTITEPDALNRIASLLEVFRNGTDSETAENESTDTASETAPGGAEESCILTLTAADGSTAEFVLQDGILRETETGREWRPDDEQLGELKEALRLPA